MAKSQYNVRMEEQLVDRLSKLAQRCGYQSGNEFAAEALDQYAELLADLMIEQADQLKLIRVTQRERLLGKSSQENPKRK